MTQYLFVYGTLAKGQPNEKVLTAIGGKWKRAFVKGTLIKQGWGSKLGYPGIILDNKSENVEGFIFSSDNLDKHWKEIDDFEGEEYKRELVKAQTKDGDFIEAYIYVLRSS